MNQEEETKKFLEDQLEWCKEQDLLLEKIEIKLHEMKKIAESALQQDLTSMEIEQKNIELNRLKMEVGLLEKERQLISH